MTYRWYLKRQIFSGVLHILKSVRTAVFHCSAWLCLTAGESTNSLSASLKNIVNILKSEFFFFGNTLNVFKSKQGLTLAQIYICGQQFVVCCPISLLYLTEWHTLHSEEKPQCLYQSESAYLSQPLLWWREPFFRFFAVEEMGGAYSDLLSFKSKDAEIGLLNMC